MQQTIEKQIMAELRGLPDSLISKVLSYVKDLKQSKGLSAMLQEMHKSGVLWNLPKKHATSFKPVKGKGKPASRVLIEDIR